MKTHLLPTLSLIQEAEFPPDVAALELGESEQQHPTSEKPKPKRKPLKRPNRLGKYSRTGGDRTNRASEIHATIISDTHTTTTTASVSAFSNSNGKLRKQTKTELINTAGYTKREKNKSMSQCNILKAQLKMQELEHVQALSKEKDLLKNTSEECKHIVTLAQ